MVNERLACAQSQRRAPAPRCPQLVISSVRSSRRLPYQARYANHIHAKSLNKASQLQPNERFFITKLCGPIYDQACTLKPDGET